MSDNCKACGYVLHGDWLTTIDGDFCDRECADDWCAIQFRLNREIMVGIQSLRSRLESAEAERDGLAELSLSILNRAPDHQEPGSYGKWVTLSQIVIIKEALSKLQQGEGE